MEKNTTLLGRIALFGAGILLLAACSSTAAVTTADEAADASTAPSVSESAPAPERFEGSPLAEKMGVCDGIDPALIGQWMGIEDTIYASFDSFSDGCQWSGDNWDTTHRAALISMVIHSQESYEGNSTNAVPFVGGPEGSLVHNNVHVYLEHEGTYLSFRIWPTRENFDDSIDPVDNLELYNEIVGALLAEVGNIEKA
jgi:hypothetical protein